MTAGRCAPIVPNREWQEGEHEIWGADGFVAAKEPACLEVIRCSRTLAEQPQQADERTLPNLESRVERDGLGAGVLHVHLQMVLQVLADARQVMQRLDTRGLQVLSIT